MNDQFLPLYEVYTEGGVLFGELACIDQIPLEDAAINITGGNHIILETKTMLVVVNEKTLGYILTNSFSVCILKLIIPAETCLLLDGICLDYRFHILRLASKGDFNNYNVNFDGYKDIE